MRVSQLVCVTSATVLLLAPVAVRAGDVLLQGDDPLAVASVDPIRPSIAAEDAATGGLDAGLPGDTSYYRLSVEPVGKRFYQTPDALMIYIDTTDVQGDLHIELGIYRSRYGSRNGEVCWDGTKILDVDAYGGEDLRVETLTHTLTPGAGIHELRVADLPGEPTYLLIDAIRLSADGDITLVDADGLPIALESPSLDPTMAERVGAELDALPDLASFGGKTRWQASETFPVRQFSAPAAFDGDAEDGDYWAGGTPAPHAIVAEYPEAITFDACRVQWLGDNRAVRYGLEAWNGERWDLVYHDPHNLREHPIYVFPPVTTDRIRFTMYELTGQNRILLRAFQLYLREGDAP